MFAVAKVQGNQYTLSEGQTFKTQKVPVSQGQKFSVQEVLLISDARGMKVGTPYLNGYEIEFEVLDHAKGEKIRVFKMKAKKRYMRTQGHRQWYSTLKVLSIREAGKNKKAVSTQDVSSSVLADETILAEKVEAPISLKKHMSDKIVTSNEAKDDTKMNDAVAQMSLGIEIGPEKSKKRAIRKPSLSGAEADVTVSKVVRKQRVKKDVN